MRFFRTSLVLFFTILTLGFFVYRVCAQKATEKRGAIGIWISPEEIAGLPVTGNAWQKVKQTADRDFGRAKGGHDDDHDVFTMAQAYVAVRLNDDDYRAKVADNLMSAIGSEDNGNVLSLVRNLIGYVIAADLIDFKSFDPEREAKFRTWLSQVRHKKLSQGTLISIQEKRPNNFGTHATAARAAAAIYLGDQTDLERTANIFKGWLGDRSSYSNFKYKNLSWQAYPGSPVGINPKGAMKEGHSVDGVLPDDQRRGGRFQWPPPKVNYVYGALQGAVAAANILSRAGYDTWNWQDKAILRAYQWLFNEAKFPPKGDDVWQLPLIDSVYGTGFWDGSPVETGKNMGWTDWTHARRSNSGTQSSTSLQGSVLNSRDNRSLSNANLELTNDQRGYQTTTSSLGVYEFNFVEAGAYLLTVTKAGFESKTVEINLTEEQQLNITLILNPLLDSQPPASPENFTAKG